MYSNEAERSIDLTSILVGLEPTTAANLREAVYQFLEHNKDQPFMVFEISWWKQILEKMNAHFGKLDAERLVSKYESAFPRNYLASRCPDDAFLDICNFEKCLGNKRIIVDLGKGKGNGIQVLSLRLYRLDGAFSLSDIMPFLENMGLRVLEQMAFQIKLTGSNPEIDFVELMVDMAGLEVHKDDRYKQGLIEVIEHILTGKLENDRFNQLALIPGIEWREISVLRTYFKYLRQLGMPFTSIYVVNSLFCNPGIMKSLIRLFRARFDPARSNREQEAEDIIAEITCALEGVANKDEDRILRRYLNIILSTVRTNYFQNDNGSDKTYLSYKFDCNSIYGMPDPSPKYEIFVYSSRMEGVHLRGGKVARGGLRWSGRTEDYRTEILGLFKAQMVKNVVIIPTGSKGGFITKEHLLGASKEQVYRTGIECYQTFIKGLLDLTDNIIDGQVVVPKNIVRHDGDDPYLVVAPDKGTSTFSDCANVIAGEYEFWLGDAFASGGSVGYDHKKLGITALGAWEAVKRHFREMGRDIQNDDFTVTGIGDMGGDVFGNGMLLSRKIKLVGAFNHQHVFIDPEPDMASTWDERKRLFNLPHSTWVDFNQDLISPGGGVFERAAKSIPLSPEAKRLLCIHNDSATPDEVIRALLCMNVDLLWLGGIGTFVKATDESHSEVRDRSNDDLRVNAANLRCKVIGEGANLGLTQRARIEFALSGGRVNNDAIDNAGGVSCSDLEVNLKVILNQAVQNGRATRAERDKLLERMSVDVVDLVLRQSYQQTQAVTLSEAQAVDRLDRHVRLMQVLDAGKRGGKLKRALEHLPDDETLNRRRATKQGLTRPEIAVLLAYTKIAVYNKIIKSDLPDDPLMEKELLDYFPREVKEKFPIHIQAHPLRREIIATSVVNNMINRVGSGFVNDLQDLTGYSDADVARAFAVTCELSDLYSIWRDIEVLDLQITAGLQKELMLEVGRVVEFGTLWFLRRYGQSIKPSYIVAQYKQGIADISAQLNLVLSDEKIQKINSRIAQLTKQGVPSETASRICELSIIFSACDVIDLIASTQVTLIEAGAIYFRAGKRFGFEWLREQTLALPDDSAWAQRAQSVIVDDLYIYQKEVVRQILSATIAKMRISNSDPITIWCEINKMPVGRIDTLNKIVRSTNQVDVSMLTTICHSYRNHLLT